MPDNRPDPHAMRVAYRIQNHLAPAITAARDATDTKIARLDGWTSASSDPHVTTSSNGSSTERHALSRAQYAADHADIHDTIGQIDTLVTDMLRMCRRMVTGSEPADDGPEVPLCMEGLTGKDGSIVWGDPTCTMPAVKKGLCQPHYAGWRRWLIAHGVDVSKHHEPAA